MTLEEKTEIPIKEEPKKQPDKKESLIEVIKRAHEETQTWNYQQRTIGKDNDWTRQQNRQY